MLIFFTGLRSGKVPKIYKFKKPDTHLLSAKDDSDAELDDETLAAIVKMTPVPNKSPECIDLTSDNEDDNEITQMETSPKVKLEKRSPNNAVSIYTCKNELCRVFDDFNKCVPIKLKVLESPILFNNSENETNIHDELECESGDESEFLMNKQNHAKKNGDSKAHKGSTSNINMAKAAESTSTTKKTLLHRTAKEKNEKVYAANPNTKASRSTITIRPKELKISTPTNAESPSYETPGEDQNMMDAKTPVELTGPTKRGRKPKNTPVLPKKTDLAKEPAPCPNERTVRPRKPAESEVANGEME